MCSAPFQIAQQHAADHKRDPDKTCAGDALPQEKGTGQHGHERDGIDIQIGFHVADLRDRFVPHQVADGAADQTEIEQAAEIPEAELREHGKGLPICQK